jgi:hypothetical protein
MQELMTVDCEVIVDVISDAEHLSRDRRVACKR